jgi:general secretion pathway protein I
LYQSREREHGSAGFTLIESLVALSIVAIALSSIGALVASMVKGARAVEGKLDRLAAVRTVLGALPDRDQLALGTRSGDLAGHRWRLDVSQFTSNGVSLQQRTAWIPELVTITVDSASAGAMQISTVRLRRQEAP